VRIEKRSGGSRGAADHQETEEGVGIDWVRWKALVLYVVRQESRSRPGLVLSNSYEDDEMGGAGLGMCERMFVPPSLAAWSNVNDSAVLNQLRP
jgi:hypothetical protein